MKRSEANEILKNREAFSSQYDAFSCVDDGVHFSHSGCDCCDSLPCDVYDVNFLSREDISNGEFTNILEGQLCGGCLCSMVNGDDSDLDYYVDDEDC